MFLTISRKKVFKHNATVKETILALSQQKSEMKSIELAVKEQNSMVSTYVAQIKIVINTVLEKFSRGKMSIFIEILREFFFDSALKIIRNKQ